MDKVAALFKMPVINDIRRPTEGEVDCLLGMDVAGYHPIRVDAIGHLLFLKNEFGLVVGGPHPTILEKTAKIVRHAYVHLSLTQFEDIEKIGVECRPRCFYYYFLFMHFLSRDDDNPRRVN